jgi:hypothetical protein
LRASAPLAKNVDVDVKKIKLRSKERKIKRDTLCENFDWRVESLTENTLRCKNWINKWLKCAKMSLY